MNGKLVVDMFMTLDGVMQGPGEPKEDTEGNFTLGGWQVPYLDEESGKLISEDIERIDALLLGRKTYEIFAAYWPKAPSDDPIAVTLNSVPKYVASRSLKSVEWNNSNLIHGDVPNEIERLKKEYAEVHLIGSGNFLQTLLKNELVDEFNLWVYPILLGTGKHIFADGTIPTALSLESSRIFDNGTLLLRYARTGKPTFGSMAL